MDARELIMLTQEAELQRTLGGQEMDIGFLYSNDNATGRGIDENQSFFNFPAAQKACSLHKLVIC